MINSANSLVFQNQCRPIGGWIIVLPGSYGQSKIDQWTIHQIQIHVELFASFSIALKINFLILADAL